MVAMNNTIQSDQLQLAAAYLSRVSEPGDIAVYSYVTEVGYTVAATKIQMGEAPLEVLRSVNRDKAYGGSPAAQSELDTAAEHGIRLITPADTEWPHEQFGGTVSRLAAKRVKLWKLGEATKPDIAEALPPLWLWVKGEGNLAPLVARSVSIVGARACTTYGNHVAAEMATDLARRSVTVVSGGAYGIDAAAHRGALAVDGPTVLVAAGGLDRPYPSGNTSIFERAAEVGCLVSEYPPGATPHRARFMARNRIIAALSSGTVCVEAAVRSGSMNTMAFALVYGRRVMAVPGPVTSAMSTGCHHLLRDGAALVTTAGDVIAACDL
jgi:DNA processing protein